MLRVLKSFWIAVVVILPTILIQAQTTYHLHAEASTTPGRLQLKKTGPDQSSVAFQSINLQGLQGSATATYVIKEFDTQAGDPGVTGTIPSGSQVSFTVWMRSTAALGVLYPHVDLRRNGPTDQAICSMTNFVALTTTLTQYTFTCTTPADANLTSSDRLYLAADVNLSTGSSSGPFAGEVDIEGTAGGPTDSQFTIPAFNTAPKITGLSPSSGAIGSAVFVSGANFGTIQGTSTISLGSTSLAPLSWSNTLIGFHVPTTASTGNVTVKVGGVLSNAIKYTVTPGISSLSPNKGGTGASVTIKGTKFGSTKGSVAFNGVTATTTSWTATKIVTTVPTAASTGPVVVKAGTLSSNPVPFNVTSCSVNSISISPPRFNLVVGQGHTLTALNNCGQAVTGVTWTIAEPNTAYVTTDVPPEIVAQNPGSTTLTATYQGSTSQATVTVYSGPDLPSGTELWSPASTAGYAPGTMIPGVPTGNNTPSFFFVEKNSSQQTLTHGIAEDGTTLWVTPGPISSYGNPFIPTDDGGIIISAADNQGTTTKIDAAGNQVWSYQTDTFAAAGAVAQDGTIFAEAGDATTGLYLLALDGATGLPKGRSPFPTYPSQAGLSEGPISIMPNGTAYVVVCYDSWTLPVWLIGLTSSGSASQQILSSVNAYAQSPGPVIPDGSGGVLATWNNYINLGSPWSTTVMDIGGSGGGTYTALTNVTQMLLGDTGAVYLLGSNSTNSNPSILAVNVSSGAPLWQWDFPSWHLGTLTTSQAGGGVVAVDATLDSNGVEVQQNVVRVDGNGIATYDIWSAGPGSLDYYGGDVWFNNPFGVVAALPISIADTDWINPSGNARRQSRPNASVKFQEKTTCSAVDDTIDPPWIMVPMSGSNGGAKAHIRGNRQDVQFVSEDPTVATVTPAAPTSGDTVITVSGLKSGQITTIDARSVSNPAYNYAQLKVVVKPRISKTLDMFEIIDPVKNLTPQNVPTSTSVQTYLNNTIWGKQANVYFDTVNSPVNVSVHYDLLPAGGDGFLNDFQKLGADPTENRAIQTAVSAINPNTGQQNRLEIDYVNRFGPPINGTWEAGYYVDGESFTGGWVSFVEDIPPAPRYNSREWVSAHEIGHAMGAGHTYKMSPNDPVNKSVMYHGLESSEDPLNPCEVRRRAWGKVNPTTNDDGTQ